MHFGAVRPLFVSKGASYRGGLVATCPTSTTSSTSEGFVFCRRILSSINVEFGDSFNFLVVHSVFSEFCNDV